MPVLPILQVEVDFADGPSFSYPLILDNSVYGILDTNVLANAPADIVNISNMVMACSTRRGRNRILTNFEAGTATVTLNDPDSDFNPQNAAGPYFGKLLPLRKIRIYALTEYLGDTVEVNLFAGYIISYDTGFAAGVYETSTVVLQCVDGFRLLNNVSTYVPAIPNATAGQLSGARIDTILDFAGFPDSMRTTDPGDSSMQVDPGGIRTILATLQTVEQSEFGAFFMQRSGKTLFLDRTAVSERADVAPRTYTDLGTAFPYSNVDFAFDDQLILNDVTVTALGLTPQIVTDQASIDKFFTKAGARSDILVETNAEALDQANTLLAARKDASLRIESIDLNMYASISELNTLVNLDSDIYNLILVEKQMAGGSSIERELFIQGVQHDITPDSWNTRLFTAEPLIQAFILNSTNQGILGNTVPQNTNTLSY